MIERRTDPDSPRQPVQSVSDLSAETAVVAHQVEEGTFPRTEAPLPAKSESVFRRRARKFRRIKRGYWSFLVIVFAYLLSFLLPILANNVALVVRYEGEYYFPILQFYPAGTFVQAVIGEPDYRALRTTFSQSGDNWVLMPPYPYGPNESLLTLPGFPPHPPSREHPFGTDDRGRDVLVRLAYGFNISVTFAILVLLIADTIGVIVGAVLGYIAGKLDLLGQRLIEVWSSLPFLYTIIIVSAERAKNK